MTKEILYKYLGTNGVIISPVHLEDIYYVRNVKLTADAGKLLTKDNKSFTKQIIVPEDEVSSWAEVDK
jgi:hypothetical protein